MNEEQIIEILQHLQSETSLPEREYLDSEESFEKEVSFELQEKANLTQKQREKVLDYFDENPDFLWLQSEQLLQNKATSDDGSSEPELDPKRKFLIKCKYSYPIYEDTPRLHLKEEYVIETITPKQWTNHIGNQKSKNAYLYAPNNLWQLQKIVKNAVTSGNRVRFAGSGHAYAAIAITSEQNDYMIHPKKMRKYLKHFQFVNNGSLINIPEGEKLSDYVEVEAGMTVQQVNCLMTHLGKSLCTMGSFQGQTIMGVISTSTHGSRIDMGPIPDMVCSFVLVDSEGNLHRIEPENGITNKAEHEKKYPSIKVTQNNDTFYSVLVSMGSMGMFYSITIKATDAFRMREDRGITQWNREKEALEEGGLLHMQTGKLWNIKGRHNKYREVTDTIDYQIALNPYPIKNELICLVTRRKKTTEAPKNHKARVRGAWNTLAHIMELLGAITSKCARKEKGNRTLARNLRTALRALKGKDGIYIDASDKIFTNPKTGVEGYGIEMAFPLTEKDPTGKTLAYLDTIEIVLKKIKQLGNPTIESNRRQMVTAPIGIRFTKASKAYLSPQYSKTPETRYAMIEVLMIDGTPKGFDTLQQIYAAVKNIYPNMRTHWGLNFDYLDSSTKLGQQYGEKEYEIWLDHFKIFNKRGTFCNKFTKQMGWDELLTNGDEFA